MSQIFQPLMSVLFVKFLSYFHPTHLWDLSSDFCTGFSDVYSTCFMSHNPCKLRSSSICYAACGAHELTGNFYVCFLQSLANTGDLVFPFIFHFQSCWTCMKQLYPLSSTSSVYLYNTQFVLGVACNNGMDYIFFGENYVCTLYYYPHWRLSPWHG